MSINPVDCNSFRFIAGLKEVYIGTSAGLGTGAGLCGSFVFETAEAAAKADEGVAYQCALASAVAGSVTNNELTSLTEVLYTGNISPETDSSRVRSYSVKTMGTAGRPIQDLSEFLQKLGYAMMMASKGSAADSSVPVTFVTKKV